MDVAPVGEPPKRPRLLELGLGVFGVDPRAGLTAPLLAPCGVLAQRRARFGFFSGALTCSGNSLTRPR